MVRYLFGDLVLFCFLLVQRDPKITLTMFFRRADGPLLQAMKSGAWVLLDELNLANQSILEGLNALLDHRGEIYVPELDSVVSCKSGFRIFGAQNPIHEGGGRKGLPRSFLNRFIRVHIRGFSSVDLINISGTYSP